MKVLDWQIMEYDVCTKFEFVFHLRMLTWRKRNFAGYFIGTWPMTFVHFPNYALIRITLVLHIFCIWIITSFNNDMSVTMQSLSLLEKRSECWLRKWHLRNRTFGGPEPLQKWTMALQEHRKKRTRQRLSTQPHQTPARPWNMQCQP